MGNWKRFVAATGVMLMASAPGLAQERYMVIGGGSTGGVFFVAAAGLARVLEVNIPNTRFTAQVTAGSIENVRLIGKGRIDCAFATSDAVYHAAKGTGPFEGEHYTNIRYMTRGYTSVFQNIVPADSSINSLSDIKGKRVGVALGLPATSWFPTLAKTYGLESGKDFSVSVLRQTELSNALRDGNIDIAINMSGVPNSSVTDLAMSRDLRFIPIDDKNADEMLKSDPYFFKAPLVKDVYPKQDADVPSLHVPVLFVCRDDIKEELAYDISKTLMEHTEDLKQIHPEAATFGMLSNAGKNMIIPIHPGAARYFTEKGVKLTESE